MLKITAAVAALALSTGAFAQSMSTGSTSPGATPGISDQSAATPDMPAKKPMKAKSHKTMAKKHTMAKKTAKKSM